jgi:O-antigen/teichoic acid export membrane protein
LKLRAAIGKLNELRANPAMLGMAGVFVLRIAITGLNFALISLAARALGEHSFGTYSILFSAAGLFCIVATFGQQVLVMRFWGEYSSTDKQGLLKGALIFSALTCLAGSLVVAVPFYVWFALSQPPMLALAVTLYMIVLSVVMTTSHVVRTAAGVGLGDGFGNLLLVIPPVLYLLAGLVRGSEAEVDVLFALMAAGGVTAIVIHAVLMWRRIHHLFPGFMACKAIYDLTRWRTRSFKLWVSNALEASNQYVDVLIVGALMSPSVAGAYFVTTRLANAFAMATDAIHMFSTRHIPDLYYRREFGQLNRLLDSVAGVTLAVLGAGMIVILGSGHWLLLAFSPAYVPYYGTLAVLSFGMAAVAAAGPSGSILMLTGHEGRYLGIIGLTVLIRTVGFFVLIPPFGVIGAVAATTVSFVLMALLLRASARTIAGIDGSVLRLLTRRPEEAVAAPAE